MKNLFDFLQHDLHLGGYKFALLCFLTAFIVTLLCIPPVIALVRRYRLYDQPNDRKEHSIPVPTMGGVAIAGGFVIALLLWFPFSQSISFACLFFSIIALLLLGIMDDLRDLSARYKFVIQIALATLVAVSGMRIQSLDGLLGITVLPVGAQYFFTVLVIVGVTNAFNLIDGIDGLAGGIAFMSLITLGLFLTTSGDQAGALIAFALAGAVLAFLYFNFNPARIFMGDTGSLVIGFVIAVLSIRLLQAGQHGSEPIFPHLSMLALGIVFVPVFDTLRVFITRTWRGGSPFVADRTHIHHLLTNQGFSHGVTAKLICCLHGFILIEVYWLRFLRPELVLVILSAVMVVTTFAFRNLGKIIVKRAARKIERPSKAQA